MSAQEIAEFGPRVRGMADGEDGRRFGHASCQRLHSTPLAKAEPPFCELKTDGVAEYYSEFPRILIRFTNQTSGCNAVRLFLQPRCLTQQKEEG